MRPLMTLADNPILRREILARLRLRGLRKSRAQQVCVGLLGLLIVWYYGKAVVAILHGREDDARDLWSGLIFSLLGLIVLIAPALLSTAVTQEKEQQTWDLLAVTRLNVGEVLVGKWVGRLALVGLVPLAALPALLASGHRGGIPAGYAWGAALFLLQTGVLYGGLGLLCSSLARRSVTATVMAVTLSALLCLGPLVVVTLLQSFGSQTEGPLWIDPFYALSAQQTVLGGGDALRALSPLRPEENPAGVTLFYWLFTMAFLAFAWRAMSRASRRNLS